LEATRIAEGYEFLWHYKAGSCYHDAVRAYCENFSNVHVVLLEDLAVDFKRELQRLTDFLSIRAINNVEPSRENSSGAIWSIALKRLLESDSRVFLAMRSARQESLKGSLYQHIVRLNQKHNSPQKSRVAKSLAQEFGDDVDNLSTLLNLPLRERWLAAYGL
jgi:hypothetical protein